MSTKEAELREQLWYGVPFKDALRDVIARNNTGYKYDELKKAIANGEDLLEDDELEQVDKTVNILLHWYPDGFTHKVQLKHFLKEALAPPQQISKGE